MGWLDRLKRRWERGDRTGLPAGVPPEQEDRLLASVPEADQAALATDTQQDDLLDEGRVRDPGDR